MWQQLWSADPERFLMVGVAQDAQGAGRVSPIVEAAGVHFPVLIDRKSRVAAWFGFQITPAGVFLDHKGAVTYVHGSITAQFDVRDPRVRHNLDMHLAGRTPHPPDDAPASLARALDVFADGVVEYERGQVREAVQTWKRALALDPDNFLIRSQIWAAEHPERFWPRVDREWQQAQLLREGYGKPLP